jgi:hypothetical protein
MSACDYETPNGVVTFSFEMSLCLRIGDSELPADNNLSLIFLNIA